MIHFWGLTLCLQPPEVSAAMDAQVLLLEMKNLILFAVEILTGPACYGTYTGFNLLKELYGQGHDPDPPFFPAKE